MKVVGKRDVETVNPLERLEDVARLQRTLNRLRGVGLVPRGVFRFTSFDEAAAWMLTQMARSAARRNSTTSSASVAR